MPTSQIKPFDESFNLMRWFSLTVFLSVALVSVLAAWVFSGFLTQRMIQQDAEVTAGFVHSLVDTENAYSLFEQAQHTPSKQLSSFLEHLNSMPDVLRTNLYSPDRTMIWSSDASLIGKKFPDNDELEEALQAELVVHSGLIDPADLLKPEHAHLSKGHKKFVESYVPILDADGKKIVGVIELYKVPRDLFQAIQEGVTMIWLTAAAAGTFLYITLFWIFKRAQRIIEIQREKLVESESIAVVGEMGSAVAHGLRNPLASIRTSAELSLDSTLPPQARESAEDIIAQVDRLEGWIRQILTYAKPAHATSEPVDINQILKTSLANYRLEQERRNINIIWQLAEKLPQAKGDAAVLEQLIGSLVSNALEAIPEGGQITVTSGTERHNVFYKIEDNGSGIKPQDLKTIFKPFFTTKPKGLGLGLPLVRRMVERLDGVITLDSTPDKGTSVQISLPMWK